MKFIQTLYLDVKKDPLEYNFGWASPKYHLMGWALSCLQIKKIYGFVELYANSAAANLLVDFLRLPYDEVHRSAKPTRHLLAIAAQGNVAKTKQALDDWYLPTNKDYEVFSKKYLMTGELQKQGDKMEAMEKWCEAVHIGYTPTIFVNGYKWPDAYSIDDLNYFLL